MQIIKFDEFQDYLGSVLDVSHLDVGEFHIWFGSNIDGQKFVAFVNPATSVVALDESEYPLRASEETTGDEELDKLLA